MRRMMLNKTCLERPPPHLSAQLTPLGVAVAVAFPRRFRCTLPHGPTVRETRDMPGYSPPGRDRDGEHRSGFIWVRRFRGVTAEPGMSGLFGRGGARPDVVELHLSVTNTAPGRARPQMGSAMLIVDAPDVSRAAPRVRR